MIQEFRLSISTLGNDQYWVRTEKVAKGVQLAEETMEWPVASWIEQTKSLMHDPLLGLLEGQPPRAIAARSDLVHLGQALHNELFTGQLRDSWITAQGVAQNRQALLRLRIGIKDSRLQQLPWEALHAGSRPLATGTDVIFSRYILDRHQLHSGLSVQPIAKVQRLRILMVIAAPSDQEHLELRQEVHRLQTELRLQTADTGDSSVDIQLKILEQPGRAELTRELERGDYQVLHYAGHSGTGNAGGDLYLVSRQTGFTERLSGEDLAGLLVNNGIKLAIFNSCRGSYSTEAEVGSQQERNLVQALIIRGMPAVIAMSERIPDQVAITFTQLLYRNLKRGQAIDLSLNRTRQGLISAYGSHQFYWLLPTLYMHPLFNGYLVKTEVALEDTTLLDAEGDPFEDVFLDPRISKDDRSSPGNLKGSVTKKSTPTDSDSSSDPRNAANLNAANPGAQENPINASGNATSQPDALLDESGGREISAAEMPEDDETQGDWRELADSEKLTGLEDAPKPALSVVASDNPSTNSTELVGERRDRSHTLHTKILTLPGAMVIALLVLVSVTAVTWLQRNPDKTSPTQSAGELSLPDQVDVALAQNDLDEVTVAIRALIEEERFSEAIIALQSASQTQQRDAVIAFLKGRSHWELVKQNSKDHSVEDAMNSWETALESESDWMEIVMALGFAQHALGLSQAALDSWQRAVKLADRQATTRGAYFSDKTFGEYALNAYAGIAIASLSLSEIETNATQKEDLLAQAESAYQQVMSQAPADFNAKSLGANWLWPEDAIIDWENTRTTLSQTILTK